MKWGQSPHGLAFSELDGCLVGRETEVLRVHSHCDTVELSEVEDGELVAKVLLSDVELQVAERTYIDDEFRS